MEIEKIKEVLRLGQGEIFEELVSLILKVKYPEYNFVHTAYNRHKVSLDSTEKKLERQFANLDKIANDFLQYNAT